MQLSTTAVYKFRQVMVITTVWVLVGLIVEFLYAIDYDPASGSYYLHFVFGQTPLQHFLITAIGPLGGGIIGGSFIIFYQRDKLKGRNYRQKLIIHTSLFILFVALFILIVGVLGALKSGVDDFWKNFYADIFSLRALRLVITWYLIVILTIFALDVSEKYGAGVLKKQLLGKYHTPSQEDRIFLFLDLKSSTEIAERIGDEKYFRMLRFLYQSANEAIIGFNGEIYQYVGDEIVISWEREEGLRNANCLLCYHAILKIIRERAHQFEETFGTVPEFKGAIHSGIVTAGEVGIIKKDIVYSGDILNSTARMMVLCRQYKVNLIVSEEIMKALKGVPAFEFRYLDDPILRGKSIRMKLFAVQFKEEALNFKK